MADGYSEQELLAELKKREREKQSGFTRAVIASLSNDEAARAEYLREQRFPNNPDVVYYMDEDGDYAYVDPTTGKPTKEFKQYFDWVDAYDVYGKIVPAIQMSAEVVGGMLGLGSGYAGRFKIPYIDEALKSPIKGRGGAAIGGAGYTGLFGGAAYGGRQLLSEVLGGPDLNPDVLREDLLYSGLFGGVPLGVSKQAKLINKFDYKDGADDLALIMKYAQDTDNQAARKYAKDNFGIDLTVAEIDFGKPQSRLVALQRYLQRGPSGSKITDYYEVRHTQINEAIDTYLSELQSGKHVTGKKTAGITGAAEMDPVQAIKDISEGVINELASKRSARYGVLLKEAMEKTHKYFVDKKGNQIPLEKQNEYDDLLLGASDQERNAFLRQNGLKEVDMAVQVDVSPIIQKLEAEIADPNIGPARKSMLEKIQKLFYDKDGNLRNTIQSLDEIRKIDLKNLGTKNNANGEFVKGAIPFSYAEDLNLLMKEAVPEYARAARIYDPTKPHLQVLEKSIVGVLSKVIGDDTKIAKTLQRVFQGNASPREVTALRRFVQTKDPQAFQNLKHMFLSDELASAANFPQFIKKVGFGNLDPRYVEALRARDLARENYQKTVAEFGTNAQQTSLAGRALKNANDNLDVAQKYLDNRKKVYQALLEPEEFDVFVNLMDTVQKASFITRATDSATQPNQRMREAFVENSRGMAGKGFDVALSILDILNLKSARNAYKNRVGDELESLTVDIMLSSPEGLKNVAEGIDLVRPYIYAAAQGAFRTTKEGVSAESPEEVTEQILERQAETQNEQRVQDLEEELQRRKNLGTQLDQALQSFQPSNIPLVPPATAVTPESMLSETILPNPKDREILERRMRGTGIGSLT